MANSEQPWGDAALPRVAFIFRVPFDLGVDTQVLGARVVVPAQEGSANSANFIVTKAVATKARLSTAVLTYRPARSATSRFILSSKIRTGLLRMLSGRSSRRFEWVVDVEIDNDLKGGSDDVRPIQELVFDRALGVLNRYLYAHVLASESASARLLTPYALDAFALVEFRGDGGLIAGPYKFELPSAHREPRLPDHELLFARLQANMRAESYGHPINDVIVWRVRAEHLINYVGTSSSA